MNQAVKLPVIFHSILFDGPASSDETEVPAFFGDLNLDQVVEAITAGREEYNLKPFFYAPLHEVDTIEYRHDVFSDLEGKALFDGIRAFAQQMRAMREHLAPINKLYYKRQQEGWFLEAVEIYCQAIVSLAQGLTVAEPRSSGFLGFRKYVTEYAASTSFTSLVAETKWRRSDLSEVRYRLHIKGNRVTVDTCDSEADWSADVEETFKKFQRGAVKDYRVKFSSWADMNEVEAKVLDLVAKLFPDVFSRLDAYCDSHRDFLDPAIGAFDREVQFYIAYLEYLALFKPAGLHFCYPRVSAESKDVHARETFDLALANKLIRENSAVVRNDFYLEDGQRIFVVTGPNQGGKTTFARTFGQLHYLASVGCLVPGSDAQLFLYDRLFTHFEREEDVTNLRGKLEDELVRIHEILQQATPNSVLIMNESFTSTTLNDAMFLSKQVLERIIQLGLLCVCVTFLDELASLSETVVSMVSTIVPENPALRTYKVVRKPADGLAYAMAIAQKYGVTYERLKERIAS